jgi:lipopolysaccharide export system permease protein
MGRGVRTMSYRTVNRYITRELLVATLVAFLFFFFIFFVNQLLLMAERILSKRVPIGDVALLVFYSLPIIVTYALPFGTLVGALMAVGRLSGDREIMALRASGIALARIFFPMLMTGLALSAAVFVFNDLFLPLGNIGLKSMLRRVIFQNPAIELEPYSVKRYENTVIITGDVTGRRIRPIMIIDQDGEGRKRVITAREAVLVPATDERGAVALELRGVFDLSTKPRDRGNYEYATADRMVYNILLKDISVSLVNPGPAEKSSVDVYREISAMRARDDAKVAAVEERARRGRYRLALIMLDAMERGTGLTRAETEEARRVAADVARDSAAPPPDRTLQGYLLEFHRKFASPLSCLVFVVFAFPAGLLARRSGRTLGFALGIVMSGLYWAMLIVSYRFGARATFSPMLAMWLPNVVVLAAGTALLSARSHP